MKIACIAMILHGVHTSSLREKFSLSKSLDHPDQLISLKSFE